MRSSETLYGALAVTAAVGLLWLGLRTPSAPLASQEVRDLIHSLKQEVTGLVKNTQIVKAEGIDWMLLDKWTQEHRGAWSAEAILKVSVKFPDLNVGLKSPTRVGRVLEYALAIESPVEESFHRGIGHISGIARPVLIYRATIADGNQVAVLEIVIDPENSP